MNDQNASHATVIITESSGAQELTIGGQVKVDGQIYGSGGNNFVCLISFARIQRKEKDCVNDD